MLDPKYIRENLEKVKKTIEIRKLDVDLDKLLRVTNQRYEYVRRIVELRTRKKEASDNRDRESGKKINQELDSLLSEFRPLDNEWIQLMYKVPNVPLDDVPEGDASHFEILHKYGDETELAFTPKDHVQLGEILDIIDIPRAAKVSGTRFGYLKGKGAILEFALVQFAMEKLVNEGFIPIIPPALIKKEITENLGYWHGKIDEKHTSNENYYLVLDPEEHEEGLYLIGTGEHSVVPMHKDEVLDGRELPKKYAAFSSCFRREAGSYGQDTKGILRVHQFDKVEMVEFVKPEEDDTERRKMLSIVEELMKTLGLPYQVVQLASGDLSFPAAETIDIETWIPSQGQYRETHSISTTTDFQARRLKTRFKGKDGKIRLVHILNGTAIAIGRIIIALLENFQQEDGSVKIPEVLHKYTGFSEIKPK